LDFIIHSDLGICNRGNTPTFRNRVRSEVIDLTLTSGDGLVRIDDWRVSPMCSFSDHARILFSVEFARPQKIVYRNPRRTNWQAFSGILGRKLEVRSEGPLLTPVEIDEAVEKVTGALNDSFKMACPRSFASSESGKRWFDGRLRRMRAESRRLWNAARAANTPPAWNAYKEAFNGYKKACNKARKESWRNFCESISDTHEASRLRKALSKDPQVPSYLQRPDGTWTESGQETLDLLVDTHFPGCTVATPGEGVSMRSAGNSCLSIDATVSSPKLEWVINAFGPYKAAGPDGVIPAMLQNALGRVTPWLVDIFKGCLRLGFIPTIWRRVRAIFIPKAGKSGHSGPKDYRPISLTSFLLKTLERLVDLRLRDTLSNGLLRKSQHAYLKGRSVETALHEVVGIVEKSLHFKEFTLAAFVDIEGAFNNVDGAAITNRLQVLGVEDWATAWIGAMLRGRIIESCLGSGRIERQVTRGTPQGGVLSPLLWLLVVDEFLESPAARATHVVAYADDIALLVTGKFPSTLSEILTSALRELEEWANRGGLGINPSKTELVLFTRRRKVEDFRRPSVGGTTLSLASEVKYLGIILDSKLDWRRNIEVRVGRALTAFYSCRRMFGARWGMRPGMVHWLYVAVILPILTYGCLVWWRAGRTKSNLQTLARVQRLACIGITGALRSTPTAGMEVILHLLPLDLHLKSVAAGGAIRLRESGLWKQTDYGHGAVLSDFPAIPESIDYATPLIDFGVNYSVRIPDRSAWNGRPGMGGGAIAVFADGSKMGLGTGAGIYSGKLGLSCSFRLPDGCSVFQAEVLAVCEAAKAIAQRELPRSRVVLYSDSRAALGALAAKVTNSKLVRACREALNDLALRHRVELCWVPGHSDIEGNEMADRLARAGSALDRALANTSIGVPLATVKRSIGETSFRLASYRWETTVGCRIARRLWPRYDRGMTAYLLALDRDSLRLLVGAITGHCLIGVMATRMGVPGNDLCRSCGDEEAQEDIEHLLCECPALQERRLATLGVRFPGDLEEVREAKLADLLRFLRATGWF
jgi:ribonuclease HI